MSSSSSVTPPSFKYDVFLSFRSEGTPDNFINRLYGDLVANEVGVYPDDQLYRRGDHMPPSDRQEIEQSRISVVIFSQAYVTSTWCLNELVHIQECKKVHRQIVIPVFYDIDPSDVRELTGSFADTSTKHEYRYEYRLLPRWRNALAEISNLDGFVFRNYKSESLLIDTIINDILEKRRTHKDEHIIIEIEEQDRGDEDNKVIHKITVERMFLAINFILEVPSTVFDKLSSVHKRQYALVIMIISLATMLCCIIELVHKGRVERVGWRWRGEKIPWFYYPTPSRTRFGTVTDFIGLLCGIFQCLFAAADYAFYLQNIDNPVKISVWPLIFSFCLLCSNWSKKSHKKTPL